MKHKTDETGARRSPVTAELGRYLLSRILQMAPTVFLIVLFAFVILHLAPGDPVQTLAGESGGATPELLAEIRVAYGLDKSLPVQFLHYASNIASGHLGFSFRANMPVLDLIRARLAPTLLLAVTSMMLGVLLGVLGGAVSAVCRGKIGDVVVSSIALLLYATPSFLIGIGLIVVFSLKFPILPTSGYADAAADKGTIEHAISVGQHLLLPTLTLGSLYGAIYARFIRGTMLEVYSHPHIRGARARGLTSFEVATRHVLRNALLPFITLVGLQAGSLLSGAILVETVFSWPGLGRLAYEALQQRDHNLLAGIVLCSGGLVVVMNLVVDVVYAVLDPRVVLR
ncbi:ABC transporter permease [Rhizobium sp. BE258]|uniref:ABC transporter permease n=1 Tax=Rhizobium sp. BE258 TaxID=2817722 RepID=UPI00286565C6|nr:ABC transporter permease [Rhizobium sp. BE258]MDR7145000.1 peptide/nickel transport system permease protein [Rhizobium sp. BE258]